MPAVSGWGCHFEAVCSVKQAPLSLLPLPWLGNGCGENIDTYLMVCCGAKQQMLISRNKT